MVAGSIDREREYSGSIGGWLREYGSDDEAAWYTFRSERVVDYVIATCLGAGIDSGSIGGWLREYGSDDEAAWYTFRSERVVDYVIATCLGAGIDAEVV